MKITIEVRELGNDELHFFEQIGEGTYNDLEFQFFSTIPDHSLEIWVKDERYLVSSEEIIKSLLSELAAEDVMSYEPDKS